MTVQASNSRVLLETVMLLVVDSTGKEIPARALLDSGSMCSFMTKKLANTLDLRRSTVDIAVSGIGESSKQIKRQLRAKIRSTVTKYATELDFLILKKPTVCLPTVKIDVAAWKIPDVDLADPHFFIPADIDLIVGGEVYHELHGGSKISLGNEMPTLVETVFGWAVSGSVPINSSETPRLCHLTTIDRDQEQSIERFWELESLLPSQALSAEETKCEEVFSATTTRDSSGRFVVRLPLTSDPLVRVGESRSIAERHFGSLERRLKRDPATREAYVCFMADYERLGHMIKLTDPVDDSVPHCYLPHHPVFKESSNSTKVRVVFDASCKTSTSYSINDMQLVGPTIQDDLLSIIMRFRTHPIALVADIEKMYRQIQLHLDDCTYQRILWRQSPEEPLATFEMQTLTYGFASAPFLATRTLQRLAEDEVNRFPVAAPAASAGFPLEKWASNVPEALRASYQADWKEFHSTQDTIATIQVPRYVFSANATSYQLHFFSNCLRYFRSLKAAARKSERDPFRALTTADLVELALCRLARKQSFLEELATLASIGRLPPSSQLKYIRTKLDSGGVIRIREVLANATVPEATKHQIVLLAKHPFSKLLAKFYHGNLLHAGPQLMLATIRQKYWIIGGRNLVRRTFHECHTCFRSRPKMIQLMNVGNPLENQKAAIPGNNQ